MGESMRRGFHVVHVTNQQHTLHLGQKTPHLLWGIQLEWDCILDCKLPDNGQRILVAIRIRGHEEVQQDEFYSDDGSYLDSGYEIGTEAVAWMPLPEPYKEDDHETD